jgi:hypothetical protein
MVPTLRLCVLYGSQNKQRLLPYTSSTDWVLITAMESLLRGTHWVLIWKRYASSWKGWCCSRWYIWYICSWVSKGLKRQIRHFIRFLFLFLFCLFFFDKNETTQFNNSSLPQTFGRFFLFHNLSSCGVFVRCITSAQSRLRIRSRTVLCKLSQILGVQRMGSLDVSVSLKSSWNSFHYTKWLLVLRNF